MLINMKKNSFTIRILFILLILLNFQKVVFSEIMHLTKCLTPKHSFVKNEYILDFEKSLMIRNFVYDNKTYKKLKLTDLSIKKKNSIERFIYKDKNFFLTDKVGYPQFYTQLLFEINKPIIKIKTVINSEEATSKMSTCKKIEIYSNES